MAEPISRVSSDDAEAWRTHIRELIKHENDLVNQRMVWLIQAQGLLFAALAFSWDKEVRLAVLLSFLGIATALSLWTVLRLYSPAVRSLREWWQAHRPEGGIEGPDVIGLFEPSEGIEKLFRPWRAFPLIFVVAWLGVLYLKWPSYGMRLGVTD